MLVLI
jgi:hypothetical protein